MSKHNKNDGVPSVEAGDIQNALRDIVAEADSAGPAPADSLRTFDPNKFFEVATKLTAVVGPVIAIAKAADFTTATGTALAVAQIFKAFLDAGLAKTPA